MERLNQALIILEAFRHRNTNLLFPPRTFGYAQVKPLV